MRITLPAAEVRRVVIEAFRDFGAGGTKPLDLRETDHFHKGRCVRRTYRAAGLMAAWVFEVGIVQVYDANGHIVRRINMLEELVPNRVAA